jgi:hypothetical protein
MVGDEILAFERAALDRWGKGDPDGYLVISAPDVTYFDPYVEHRLDGRAARSLVRTGPWEGQDRSRRNHRPARPGDR